jgi:hypothetical protein
VLREILDETREPADDDVVLAESAPRPAEVG